ncbi:MAG: anti-anti-sigma regulatory factor [Polaribacter sp.]|jgi:anti-anti-sigma regulatory factor
MTVNTNSSNDGQKVTISVIGKLDFQLYSTFRYAYSDTNGSSAEYIVDFSMPD